MRTGSSPATRTISNGSGEPGSARRPARLAWSPEWANGSPDAIEQVPHRFVYKPVDGLCKTALNLCTIQKIQGMARAASPYDTAAAWKNNIHILCTIGTATFVHMPRQANAK